VYFSRIVFLVQKLLISVLSFLLFLTFVCLAGSVTVINVEVVVLLRTRCRKEEEGRHLVGVR